MAAIFICTCDHTGQDSMYGHSRRVHNEKKNGSFRCTVCGESRSGNEPAIARKSVTITKAKFKKGK